MRALKKQKAITKSGSGIKTGTGMSQTEQIEDDIPNIINFAK